MRGRFSAPSFVTVLSHAFSGYHYRCISMLSQQCTIPLHCTSNSLVDARLNSRQRAIQTSQSHRQSVLTDAFHDAPFTIRLALSFQLLLPYTVQCMFAQAAAWPRRLDADKLEFLKPPSAPNRIGAGSVIYSSSPDCRVRERRMSRTRMFLFMALNEGEPLCGIGFVLPRTVSTLKLSRRAGRPE